MAAISTAPCVMHWRTPASSIWSTTAGKAICRRPSSCSRRPWRPAWNTCGSYGQHEKVLIPLLRAEERRLRQWRNRRRDLLEQRIAQLGEHHPRARRYHRDLEEMEAMCKTDKRTGVTRISPLRRNRLRSWFWLSKERPDAAGYLHHQRWRILLVALSGQHFCQGCPRAGQPLARGRRAGATAAATAAGERYFRVKTQALDEDAPELRARASEEVAGWHAHLLQALGYTEVHAFDMPVEGGTTHAPLRGRITRYYRPWLALCETHFCLPDGSLKEGMPSEDPLA